jgi:hypothetical protein
MLGKFFAVFPTRITRRQARDTGMAMVLICLLAGHIWDQAWLFKLAIPLLVLNMILPMLFRPLATIWLGLSTLLGTVMSRVILTLIFFLLVTPIGLVRRAFGRDSLKLRMWKRGPKSVLRVRDRLFQPGEIEKPY